MTGDLARRAHELFKRAAELETSDRGSFLDETCHNDGDLRSEVDALLCAWRQAGDFLETSAFAQGAIEDALDHRMVGRRVGRYTIQSILGSGGMGTVFLAEQDHPRRTVALKIMRAGIPTRAALRRFEFESEVLGRLSHPNVAQVYEAGTHEAGGALVPYFAMEYVAGAEAITRYAESRGLETQARLELFTEVCAAVHHGHQKGVIHRDLKPANILVDPTTGEPKIIDFGVAREAGDEAVTATTRTGDGHLVGTLPYMSPEQYGDTALLDIRCDVYALGIVLYELLCGTLPYDLSQVSPFDAARLIRESPPVRPGAVDRALRGDLETITMTAIEQQRDRRYQSAADLSQDIRRYLAHLPIEARPTSVLHQIHMFARRHRAMCAAVAMVVVTLLAASAVSVGFAIQAEREAGRARDDRDAMRWRSYVGSIAGAEAASEQHEFTRMRILLKGAAPDHRGWEWGHLARRSEPNMRTYEIDGVMLREVAVSDDGALIAAASMEGDVRVLDVASGRVLLAGRPHELQVRGLVFEPGGHRLASAGEAGRVLLWEPGSSQDPRLLVQVDTQVRALAFTPDGTGLIVAAMDGVITTLRVSDGATVGAFQTHSQLTTAALSGDGTRLVTGTIGGDVAVWHATTGERKLQFERLPLRVDTVAIDRTGRVAAAHTDGSIRRWGARGDPLPTFEATGPIDELSFGPDGTRLYAAGRQSIDVWNWAEGALEHQYWGHESRVQALALGPAHRHLYSSSWDGTVRAWEIDREDHPVVLRAHDARVRCVTFGPNGARLATAADDGAIILWDSLTYEALRVFGGDGAAVHALAFSHDGVWLADGGPHGIRIRDARTGTIVADLECPSVRGLAFAPNRTWLVAGEADGHVRRWDLRTFEERDVLGIHDRRVYRVAVNRDGTRVASASRDHTVKLFDTANDREIPITPSYELDVFDVAFSPDGKELVSTARGPVMHVWSAETGAYLRTIADHGQTTSSLAFNTDGSRLAVGTWYDTVMVLEMPGGEPLATLRGHDSTVWTVAFSPGGSRIASGSFDTTVRVWDSVPETRRRAQREAIRSRAAEAERLVDTLAAEYGHLEGVADALRADESLDASLRRAALNAVLRRAAAAAD